MKTSSGSAVESCVPQILVFLQLSISNRVPQTPKPSHTALPNLVFPTVSPSGPQLQIFLPPYGPNPIIELKEVCLLTVSVPHSHRNYTH